MSERREKVAALIVTALLTIPCAYYFARLHDAAIMIPDRQATGAVAALFLLAGTMCIVETIYRLLGK